MKSLKRNILLMITAIALTACANKYDAQIAQSEASIEIAKENAYAMGIKHANKPKTLVRIDGEVRCTEYQKSIGNCGVSFFNPNAKSIIPQRDKNWVDGVESITGGIVKTLEVLTPIALAKEVTNIVDSVGNSAGRNTTNTNSNNVTKSANQANSDIANNATTTNTKTLTNTETVNGVSAGGDIDQSQQNKTSTENVSTNDNSTSSSNNTDTETSTLTSEEDSVE